MLAGAAGGAEEHAVFTEGDDEVAHAVAGVEAFANGVGREGLAGDPGDVGEFGGFAAIGGEEVELRRGEGIAGFGIEGDEFAGGTGGGNDPGDEFGGEDAFGVVGEDDGIGGGESGGEGVRVRGVWWDATHRSARAVALKEGLDGGLQRLVTDAVACAREAASGWL